MIKLESYEGVTRAGFHALHRLVWNEIVEQLKSRSSIEECTKEAAFRHLNLPDQDVTYDCFACVVSINRLIPVWSRIKCDMCPVVEWKGKND